MKRTFARFAALLTAAALMLSILCGCGAQADSEPPIDLRPAPTPTDSVPSETDEGPGYPIVHIAGVELPEEFGDGYLNCEAVFWLINYLRGIEGLPELKRCDEELRAASIERLDESTVLFSHTRPNGEKFSTVLTEHNIVYTYCAENLAGGQFTAEHVVHDWLGSDTHRANLFSPEIEYVCIACVVDKEGVPYWVFEGVRYDTLYDHTDSGYDYGQQFIPGDLVVVSSSDVTPTDYAGYNILVDGEMP